MIRVSPDQRGNIEKCFLHLILMRSYKLYLNDILDAMRKVLEYTKGMDY